MLVFCTSYVRDERAWQERYARWLDYNLELFPDAQFAFIDDASPWLPKLAGIEVLSADSDRVQTGQVGIYSFEEHKGIGGGDFEGWFRSFCRSVDIAERLGHEKIIHVESDAFIVSRRMRIHLEGIYTGWTAFWCTKLSVPETAVQVICADQFAAVKYVSKLDYEANFRRQFLETVLPFSHVERAAVYGNRFGEMKKTIPSYADFACQITPDIAVPRPSEHRERRGPIDWLLNRYHALLYRRI